VKEVQILVHELVSSWMKKQLHPLIPAGSSMYCIVCTCSNQHTV
jgi:hypothetical protein